MKHNRIEPGTVLEFDFFKTIALEDNKLLVFDSSNKKMVSEGSILVLRSATKNDWTLTIAGDSCGWYNTDHNYLVRLDWNQNAFVSSYDPYDDAYDYDDFWADDELDILEEELNDR